MSGFKDKDVIATGASSGIGLVIARRLVEHRTDLKLSERNVWWRVYCGFDSAESRAFDQLNPRRGRDISSCRAWVKAL